MDFIVKLIGPNNISIIYIRTYEIVFSSERAGSVIQPCNCPGLVSGFGGQTCSCIQQQQQRQQRHQNTLASMTPYLHSPYPVLPVHHIAPGAVSFSPIPISGAVAFPQVVSAAHGQPEIIPNRMEETYYQRHMVIIEEDSFLSLNL